MACQSSDTELNEFTDENPSFLDMEIEALQSIFINELEVKDDENYTTVSIEIYPSTADKLDEQYVRMTLEFILNEEYPESVPDIKIRNPRGLSDEELNSIIQDLCNIAESKKGSSMLFEMIDAAKEHLTVGNRPCGECAICLHGFSENDVFTKTECYHYFHSHCLARYARNFFENSSNSEDEAKNNTKNDELLCPMCRIPITFDEWDADYPPPEESEENSFTLSEEMMEVQKKMATLFQKQVQKGGIIDVEAEKNKYLLEISNVPTRLSSEEKSEQKFGDEDCSVADSKNLQSEEIGSPICNRRNAKDHSRNFDHRGRNKNYNRPNDSRNYNRPNERRNYDRPNESRNYNRSNESRNYNRPNESRNYNRPNENRNYNRYGQRYNKQAFNHGNFSGYEKQNSRHSYQDDIETPQHENKDSSLYQDITKSEEQMLDSSQDVVEIDDTSELSEYSSPNMKPKYNSNSRYNNKGYTHGQNNYNYDSSRRTNKFSYNERQNSHRYSVQREESSNKFEKKAESDLVTCDDSSNYKSDYRSGNYKRDNGYSKQRYSDNKNNSPHGYKGAYSGRDGYSGSYNSRSNRYSDSKDSEQYSERNFREKQTYRDMKYKNDDSSYNYRDTKYKSNDEDTYNNRDMKFKNDDTSYNYRDRKYKNNDKTAYSYSDVKYKNSDETTYNYRDRKYKNNDETAYSYNDGKYKNSSKTAYNNRDVKYKNNDESAYNRSRQSNRNYAGSKSERYSDKSYNESSNNESKALDLNNQNQNGDHDKLPEKNSSSDPHHNSSQREKSSHKKDVTSFEEKNSSVVSAFNSSISSSFPNAFSENSDIAPRTVNPPPGFANPMKKVVYGLQGANPPPGFNKS